MNPRRKILALKFQLESTDGRTIELIAWLEPDGNGKHLYQKNSLRWHATFPRPLKQ